MVLAFSIILAIVAVALIIIVAIQPSKGEGLGSIGGGAHMFFGKHKGIDILLDRATWVLSVLLAVLCILLTVFDKG